MPQLLPAKGFPSDRPILAENDFQSAVPPPGYAFLEGEPRFDPSVHLQLEKPGHIWTLADLGYDECFMAGFPSTLAFTSPVRLLSAEGVAVLEETSRRLQSFVRHRPGAARVPAVLRGTVFRSRFIRDLCFSPDVAAFFSEICGTPLMPHAILHDQGHMNFAPMDLAAQVDSWHHDSVAFDYVLMVHDPRRLKGGRFELFLGTREEGAALVEETGDIPRERVYTPDFPGPGYACYMQGATVFHRASRLEEPGYRASFVQSYTARDVRFPDVNRFYHVKPSLAVEADPNAMLERRGAPLECARHRARMSRARLGWIMRDMPFTDDPRVVAERLEAAVADVTSLIEILKDGYMSAEEAEAYRQALDEQQTSRKAGGRSALPIA